MSKWTDQLPQAARDYIGNRRVDEVECVIGDIAGVARGKAMPAAKFAHQKNYFLPNSIFLQTITGEWADSPFDAFTEPDMILEPDWTTATAAPWTADITLQVIHDAKDQEGNLVPYSPRNVLRRVLALYEAQGWKPVVAPEMEFFLTARNIDPNQPVIPPMGRSGRRAAGKQAYSLSAVDEYGKVIDDIYDFAEAMGLDIDGILQEGGAGQIELNLAHGDPIRLSDDVFFFKRMIREAALRHDCFATFMAKPIAGEPGS
ncbi:MAG: glutamine synthetase, partial [Paracoccaceae bacterium]